jgi:hypothetical protein
MALHIVTSKCFLTCDKILYIKLEERPDDPDAVVYKPKKKGRPSKKEKAELAKPQVTHRIMIGYYPVSASNNNYNGGPNECCLEVTVPDKQTADALYMKIVREVQEQHPNELYLDKLVHKMLASDEFKIDAPLEE